MAKLTSKYIESLPAPSSGQVILRDEELVGFGLRMTPNRMTYIAESRVNGTVRRVTIGRADLLPVDEARKEARRLLALMASGKDPADPADNITLGEVLQRYLEARTLRKNSITSYRNVLRQRMGDWMSLPMGQITRQMVHERFRYITTDGGKWKASAVQANIALRALRMLFNFAIAHYTRADGTPLLPSNPVNVITSTKSWNRVPHRQGIIPDHRLNDFYQALVHPLAKDYLLLVLLTGLRRTEALSLRWTDIDFDSRVLTIQTFFAKNHHEHRLPIAPFLLGMFKKRKVESQSEWVFPGKHGGHAIQISYITERVEKLAGFHFSVHCLRRTFLTMAEKLGVPYYQIKKLANHAIGNDVTFSYLVVDVERLREPMERINQRLLDLLHKEATLEEALERYILGRPLTKRTQHTYRTLVRQKLGDWLTMPITQITPDMVKGRHREIKTSSGQADMTIRVLGLLLKARGLPVPKVTSATRRARNRKVIPDTMLRQWYQSVMKLGSKTIRDLLVLLLFTGLQKSQVASLRWDALDLEEGTLAVGENKLPLCSFLLDMLRSRERRTEYIFPGRQEGIVQIYQGTGIVMKEIGMQFTVHDLRRTYYRHARLSGVSRSALLRMDPDELREPVERIAARLIRLTGATTPNTVLTSIPVGG